MKPLFDRILVELVTIEEKTAGGLLIAPGRNETSPLKYGKVIAVGPGQYMPTGNHRPMSVKVGDTVSFPSGNGFDMRVQDKACRIMREEEVLCVQEGV